MLGYKAGWQAVIVTIQGHNTAKALSIRWLSWLQGRGNTKVALGAGAAGVQAKVGAPLLPQLSVLSQ